MSKLPSLPKLIIKACEGDHLFPKPDRRNQKYQSVMSRRLREFYEHPWVSQYFTSMGSRGSVRREDFEKMIQKILEVMWMERRNATSVSLKLKTNYPEPVACSQKGL